MIFQLNDGTTAILKAIVQTANYRRGYETIPSDPIAEIERIAQLHTPADCWAPAKMIVIGMQPGALSRAMNNSSLPPVLCIGEFVSYRKIASDFKAKFLKIVWMQKDMETKMDNSNLIEFSKINWDAQ